MKRKVELLLLDALGTGRAIARLVNGRDYEEYLADESRRWSVLWNLGNAGEALNQARREDDKLEMKLPAFRSVVGLRNRIIHDYRNIDNEVTERLSWLHNSQCS